MSIENPLDLDAVLANIEQTYSVANEQWHEKQARESAERLMRDHCEELVEELRAARETIARITEGVTDASGLPGAPLAVPLYRSTQRFADDEFTVGAYNDGIDAAMLAVEQAIKGAS